MEPDADLLRRLRAGDEDAFVTLVERYNGSMLRLALSFAPSHAVAEGVVKDTWLAVLRGLAGFAGFGGFAGSPRSWIFTILVNRAGSTRLAVTEADAGVDASRFGQDGAWSAPPGQWIEAAENRFESGGLAGLLQSAIDGLPARQRAAVLLRDAEGMSSAEVCSVLAVSKANQRALLHRGRGRLRQVLESELGQGRSR